MLGCVLVYRTTVYWKRKDIFKDLKYICARAWYLTVLVECFLIFSNYGKHGKSKWTCVAISRVVLSATATAFRSPVYSLSGAMFRLFGYKCAARLNSRWCRTVGKGRSDSGLLESIKCASNQLDWLKAQRNSVRKTFGWNCY